MSGPLLLGPVPVSAVTGGVNPGNLLTEDPREIWTVAAGGNPTLQVDLGRPRKFDTIFLGHARLGLSASLFVSIDGVYAGTVPFAIPRLSWRPSHALLALDKPVSATKLVVRVTDVPDSQSVEAGVLMIGNSLRPTWPQEWGSGRPVIDCGSRDRLVGGGFAIDRGTRKSGWQWTLGDLTDDETQQLFDLALERGESGAMLAVEDFETSAGLCERIHYGVLDRIEPFERRDVGITRWSLRVEDWL